MRRRAAAVVALLTLSLLLVACDDGDSGTPTSTSAGSPPSGSITVSAASSLTEAFGAIGRQFTRANPNASVTFNFGSSVTLALQILQGAPADTFASADTDLMDRLVDNQKIAGPPTSFARNRLVIVTKPGNPERIETLADLANASTLSLCATTVPCGKYAAQVLQQADVTIPESNVTRGQDVKATLAAVTTGDADAAIVYVTDAKTAGKSVSVVPIPDAQNAIATYPIATVKTSSHQDVSDVFIAFLLSAKGQATLRAYGFLPPPKATSAGSTTTAP